MSLRLQARSAPFSRTTLRKAQRPLRLAVGLLLVAYSSVATILWVADFLAPVLPNQQWFGVAATLVVGFLINAAIIGGEWVLSESRWYWYALPFVPDVVFTYLFTAPWVTTLAEANSNGAPWTEPLAIGVSVAVATAVAYCGELLLFGRRSDTTRARRIV
jgi:hypothetical protein